MGIAVLLTVVVAFALRRHFKSQDFVAPTRLELKYQDDISDSTIVR